MSGGDDDGVADKARSARRHRHRRAHAEGSGDIAAGRDDAPRARGRRRSPACREALDCRAFPPRRRTRRNRHARCGGPPKPRDRPISASRRRDNEPLHPTAATRQSRQSLFPTAALMTPSGGTVRSVPDAPGDVCRVRSPRPRRKRGEAVRQPEGNRARCRKSPDRRRLSADCAGQARSRTEIVSRRSGSAAKKVKAAIAIDKPESGLVDNRAFSDYASFDSPFINVYRLLSSGKLDQKALRWKALTPRPC